MRVELRVSLLALATLAIVDAPVPVSAQLFVTDPVYPAGPIEGSDPLLGIALPSATPAEYRAHLLWNFRSGLNVAALQCQFSPFLRTVDSYNTLINQHAHEFQAAYDTLQGYFRRVGGRNAASNFDRYSTQTYNNFSTLQAQYGFCQTAARIGKDALSVHRGELGQFARMRMRELRNSLIPATDYYAFDRQQVILTPLNLGGAQPRDCAQLRGRERRECEHPR